MIKRFLLATLVAAGVHFALTRALTLLLLVLFVLFFTEEGPANFVETGVIPAVFSLMVALSFPGELLVEKLRFDGASSEFNPLLKLFMVLLNSLLWGTVLGFVWVILKIQKRRLR